MSHRNAPLSETGRLRLARCVVDDGWPLRRAAERFQVSATTAARWAPHAAAAERRSRQPRTPRFAHRLFIEYGETQRDRTRMVQAPPKSNLLLRAINRERSSTSEKVEVQKPVSQVRILPGAQDEQRKYDRAQYLCNPAWM